MKEIIKQFAGAGMVISFMLCYVPQIMRILKHKRSKDVSPGMIFLAISGYLFGLLYMACTAFGIWWFLNYTSGIATSLVLLYYWYKHKHK